MLKINKKILFFICAACVSLVLAGALSFPFGAVAESVVVPYENVNAEYGYVVPESSGLSEKRAGLKLTSSVSGSKFRLGNYFGGTFTLDFRVISELSYSGSLDAALGSEYINNELELQKTSVTFTDKNGKSFSLILRAGAKYDVVTPTASVAVGNAECGLHYYNGQTEESNTGVQNSLGYYTRFNGTSFCNVALTDGKLTTEGVKPMVITFEPSTMRVYGIYYGQSVSIIEKRLILDLKDPEHIGKNNVLESFDEYDVTMSFDSIATGKKASIVLYELNGCALGSKQIGSALPVIAPALTRCGTAAEKYILPEPAFFALDGKSSAKAEISITGPDGKKVDLTDKNGNKAEDGLYSEGCGFTPYAAGIYKLSYTPISGGTRGIVAETEVEIMNNVPSPIYSVSSELNGKTFGKGYTFIVPRCEYYNPFLLKNAKGVASASLRKDGKNIADYDLFASDNERKATLDESGEYELVYSAGEEFDKKIIAFTAVDGKVNFKADGCKERYSLNEKIELPRVTAQYGEKEKSAEVVLIKPDGSLDMSFRPTLSDKGTYSFVYYADFDGAVYQSINNFVVSDGENDLFESLKDSKFSSGEFLNYSVNEISGLKVTGNSDGAKIRYGKTIDLSHKTREQSLIELAVTPSVYGEEDFNQLSILLTDVHDTTNYVQITVYKGKWGNSVSFVKAAAKGQVVAGLEKNKLATRYDLGTSVMMSFAGNRVIGSETLKLYYDNIEKAVYADTLRTPSADGKVNDFDSPELQGETSVWGGFTSGEVTMTITMSSFNKKSGSYIITSVDGNKLGNVSLNDEVAPEIYVDIEGYGNAAPAGRAGRQYKVFGAKAYDRGDGAYKPVKKAVFRNYGTSGAVEYELSADGVFTPDVAGKYTVVYTAADSVGNKAEKNYGINVSDDLPEITLEGFDEIKGEYFVGETLVLPVMTAKGGSGNPETTLTVSSGGVSETIYSEYTFNREGEYVLKAKVIDYLGLITSFSKTVRVAVSDAPITEFPEMPVAFINGCEYDLPDFKAVDYTTGSATAAVKKAFVSPENENDFKEIKGKFVPDYPSNVKNLKVKVIAVSSKGGESVKEYLVPLLRVKNESGGIDMSNLFVKNDVTAVKGRMYCDFITSKDGASFTLANAVIANGLNLEFGGDGEKIAFTSVTVTITDSVKRNQSVSFTLGATSAVKSQFSASGKKVSAAMGSMAINNPFRFTYSSLTQTLKDQNALTNAAQFKKYDDGSEFNGFDSEKVLIKFKFNGVKGDSLIRLAVIGNQTISSRNIDAIAPQISFGGEVPLSAGKGEKVILPKPVVADVFDPSAKVMLTVYDPKGSEILTSHNPCEEELSFIPDSYGVYGIVYTVYDAFGNSMPSSYNLTVSDNVPPVLTIKGELPSKIKAGSVLTFPEASVTDNLSAGLKADIFVIEPCGAMKAVGKTYKFTRRGKYLVRYFAKDENYNFATKEFVITVV